MSLKSVEFFLKIVSLSKSLFQKKIFPSICTWVERFHLNVSPRLAFNLFAYENAVRKELKQLIMKCDCKILRRSSILCLTAKITSIPNWYSCPVTQGVPSVTTSLAISCCYLHLQPLTRSSPATCASKGINGSGAGACLWPHPVCVMGVGQRRAQLSCLYAFQLHCQLKWGKEDGRERNSVCGKLHISVLCVRPFAADIASLFALMKNRNNDKKLRWWESCRMKEPKPSVRLKEQKAREQLAVYISGFFN